MSDIIESNHIATSIHHDVFTSMLLSTSRDFPIPLEFSSTHSSSVSSLDSTNENPRTLNGFHATLHSVDAFSSLLTQLPKAKVTDPARSYYFDRNVEFDVASLIPPAPMDDSSNVVENACNSPYLSCDSIKPASTNHAQPPTFQRKRRSDSDWDDFLNAAYANDESDNESQSDVQSRSDSPFDAEMPSNSPQRHERSKVFSTLCHGLALAPSTVPNGGWGVFATRFFNKNEHISSYDGALLDRSEAERRLRLKQHTHIRSVDRHSLVDGIVDPLPGNGLASFMNDGRDVKKNNAKLHIGYDNVTGVPSLYVSALRHIFPGEEIFISYGNGYWKSFENEALLLAEEERKRAKSQLRMEVAPASSSIPVMTVPFIKSPTAPSSSDNSQHIVPFMRNSFGLSLPVPLHRSISARSAEYVQVQPVVALDANADSGSGPSSTDSPADDMAPSLSTLDKISQPSNQIPSENTNVQLVHTPKPLCLLSIPEKPLEFSIGDASAPTYVNSTIVDAFIDSRLRVWSPSLQCFVSADQPLPGFTRAVAAWRSYVRYLQRMYFEFEPKTAANELIQKHSALIVDHAQCPIDETDLIEWRLRSKHSAFEWAASRGHVIRGQWQVNRPGLKPAVFTGLETPSDVIFDTSVTLPSINPTSSILTLSKSTSAHRLLWLSLSGAMHRALYSLGSESLSLQSIPNSASAASPLLMEFWTASGCFQASQTSEVKHSSFLCEWDPICDHCLCVHVSDFQWIVESSRFDAASEDRAAGADMGVCPSWSADQIVQVPDEEDDESCFRGKRGKQGKLAQKLVHIRMETANQALSLVNFRRCRNALHFLPSRVIRLSVCCGTAGKRPIWFQYSSDEEEFVVKTLYAWSQLSNSSHSSI